MSFRCAAHMSNLSASTVRELIVAAAKVHLGAIGMHRMGSSRLWVKDNGWWLAVVEFQPSAWASGTYLNVAASWLWHAKDHLAFDVSKRVAGFTGFVDPQRFAAAANQYASRAATEIEVLCRQFASPDDVAIHLHSKVGGNPWDYYHAMMASLASGDLARARAQQAALEGIEDHAPWCAQLKAKASGIMRCARDGASALSCVSEEILSSRTRLKLPDVGIPDLWA